MKYSFDEEKLKNKYGLLYLTATIGAITSGFSVFLTGVYSSIIPLIAIITLLVFASLLLKGYIKVITISISIVLLIINFMSLIGYSPIDNYKSSQLLNSAINLLDEDNYSDALQLLQNEESVITFSRSKTEKNCKRLQLIGKALWKEGKLDEAIQSLDKAKSLAKLEDNILLADIFYTYGNIYSSKNHYNKAEKSFKKAIEKGLNNNSILLDLSITQKYLNRLEEHNLIKIVDSIGEAKTYLEKKQLISAYRLMADISNDPKEISNLYLKAIITAEDDIKLSALKLVSYGDWIYTQYKSDEIIPEIELSDAYKEIKAIMSHGGSDNDIDRAKIDVAIKLAILYKDKAEAATSASARTLNYSIAVEILNSMSDIVTGMETDKPQQMKWYLHMIDLCSLSEDYSGMMQALQKADKLIPNMSVLNKKHLSSIHEYYQVKGLIHYYYQDIPQVDSSLLIAKESLIKSYSIKYIYDVGDLRDLRRIRDILEELNVKGLPDNYQVRLSL